MSGEMGRWKWGPMIATVSAEAEVVATKTKMGCVYTSEPSLGKLSCVSLPAQFNNIEVLKPPRGPLHGGSLESMVNAWSQDQVD